MMKNIFNRFSRHFSKLIAIAAVSASFVSCDDSFIYDYEGDCDPHYFIKFEYTMHMEKGDAFKEQVEAVDLWIFNEDNGEFVDHIYTTVADMAATDYLLPIDVKPGNYNFVAWCGDIDNRHFSVSDRIDRREDATCRLSRRLYEGTQATSKEDLDLLFHGKLDGAVLPDQQGKHIYTIPLIRDVNNIELTLQHISGEFDTEHIEITMVDNNGFMFHNNLLDENDEDILYRPWSLRQGMLEDASEEARIRQRATGEDAEDGEVTTANFLNLELSTARLMAAHNPVITIRDTEKDEILFQIPLVKWLLQLKSKRYADMEDQEYLDRKNQHELMVFLQDDGDSGWTAVSVVINGWHIIDNGQENL